MIKLPDLRLPKRTQSYLARYQSQIDGIADYSVRVAMAKKGFGQRNKGNNATFRAIREALTSMCSGVRRCMYCEDSLADEIEHIRPKDLYPEFVFAWENYLYSCGPCNVQKTNKYKVFPAGGSASVDVTRRRDDPVVPPIAGDPVLIDPRIEDPMEYMELDLLDTFFFLPVLRIGSRQYERAEYTIEVLGLNDRDVLPAARKEAYDSYRARLREYVEWRDEARPQRELVRLVEALTRMGHPTVWHEMKRQGSFIPELQPLFDRAPEALRW